MAKTQIFLIFPKKENLTQPQLERGERFTTNYNEYR